MRSSCIYVDTIQGYICYVIRLTRYRIYTLY